MTCRPEALDLRLPAPFRPLAKPRRVVVVKRKHGERRDRWQWDGDLIGTAGRGWRVVRHVRGRSNVRTRAADDEETLPDSEITLRWLGTRAPATILVKLDELGGLLEVKVDAALPVPFRRGRFVFVDLDVDVVRDASGAVEVRDWDTFEGRVASSATPPPRGRSPRAGESFGLALLEAWQPTLEGDIAAILAATPAVEAV